MINPAKVLQLKRAFEAFSERHPKFMNFIRTLTQTNLSEGTIAEVTITLPDGRSFGSNLKLTQEDLEFITEIGQLGKDLM